MSVRNEKGLKFESGEVQESAVVDDDVDVVVELSLREK